MTRGGIDLAAPVPTAAITVLPELRPTAAALPEMALGGGRAQLLARLEEADVRDMTCGVPVAQRVETEPGSTVILCAAPPEPGVTADARLALEQPEAVISGLRLLMQLHSASDARVLAAPGPVADRLRPLCKGGVRLEAARRPYPYASPAFLDARRSVIYDAATAAAVSAAVYDGLRQTRRLVAVSGDAVSRPGIFSVPLGTPVQAVLQAADGLLEMGTVVLRGGAMTGVPVPALDTPVDVTLSAVTGLRRRRQTAGPCIRCGRCAAVCPMGLRPDQQRMADALRCRDCGCCSYICPAGRPLRFSEARLLLTG